MGLGVLLGGFMNMGCGCEGGRGGGVGRGGVGGVGGVGMGEGEGEVMLEHAHIVWEGGPEKFAAEMGTGYL